MAKATVVNPKTGQRKVVNVGDPNAFAGGFQLEQGAPKPQSDFGRSAQEYQSYIDSARKAFGADTLEGQVQQGQTGLDKMTRGQQSYIDAIRKSLLGRDQDTKALIKDQSRLTEQQYTNPTQERERLIAAGITDPFERQGRIDQAYGNLQGNLSGVRENLSQRKATREDLVNTGAQGYQTEMSLRQQALQRLMGKADEKSGLATGFATDYRGRQQALGDEARQREQQLADEERQFQRQRALANESRSGSGSDSGFKDRILTFNEAKQLGVPVGTTLSSVIGRDVPTPGTTSYENFIKDANLRGHDAPGGMGPSLPPVDPRSAYQDYLEAQQIIDQDPGQFDAIRNDPQARPFAHLLRPKSSNPLMDALSGLLSGQEIGT